MPPRLQAQEQSWLSLVLRVSSAPQLVVLPQRIPTWLVAVLLGGLGLVPRALGLADFYTIDEAYHWPARTRAFAQAILAHDWAATNQTGHPGVTTMWLGALGYWLRDWVAIYPPGRTGDGASYLALLRLPLAVADSLGVAGGYVILRRLIRPPVALLAGLLWATAPFLIAHSRVLHLDAILTTCMSLSLLCLLVATANEHVAESTSRQAHPLTARVAWFGSFALHAWAFLASALFAGLALLTKAPALILLPFAGIWLVLAGPQQPLVARLRWASARYLLWLGCAIIVVWVSWPAMWVAPREAIVSVAREILDNGGQPHAFGNYFRGQPVADPGWAFYPAVVAWRSTPLALLGLALAPLAIWRQPRERPWLLALLGFALFFMLVMGREPKKFDRYLLPIWPSLVILAAAGLATPAEMLARWLPLIRIRPITAALGAVALIAALLAEVLAYHPYTLAYFNPFLGGGAGASKVLLIGWGEGMEQAGAWLRARPDLAQGSLVARNPPTLEPFVPMRVRDLTLNNLLGNANYAVLYVSYLQRHNDPEVEAYLRGTPPLHTVTINGIPYATIYQLPRPFERPIDATFAGGIHLRGSSQKVVNGAIEITPSWDIQRDQPADLFVFIHLLDPAGRHIAQLDVPLDNRFTSWQAGQQLASRFSLAWPADLPAGSYRAVMGVYDPESGQRAPVVRGPALPESIDGPGVVEVGAFDWPTS